RSAALRGAGRLAWCGGRRVARAKADGRGAADGDFTLRARERGSALAGAAAVRGGGALWDRLGAHRRVGAGGGRVARRAGGGAAARCGDAPRSRGRARLVDVGPRVVRRRGAVLVARIGGGAAVAGTRRGVV